MVDVVWLIWKLLVVVCLCSDSATFLPTAYAYKHVHICAGSGVVEGTRAL